MSFFEELKRRKVFRVAATYAIVSWILMQIGEVTFPALNIPEWVMSTLVVVLLAGFPIAVIFAWIFDKTPQGFIKTDSPDTENIGGMNVKVDSRPFYLQKRNLVLAIGVVAGILIGTYGGSVISSKVDSKSIAVLPFDNYSTAPEDQYFSDGVTEMIITNLAKVKDLKVISRTSVMEYKNTTKKIKDIAKELGVAHILEGSIQRVGENVRIVGQLINASSDDHIWAESYDGNISELFSMQNDVAIEIAEAMKSELTTDEKARINYKLTESTVAYEYYLKGNMYDNAGHSESNIRAAIAEYERAISLDPNFAEAHAQLGKMHAHIKWYRFDLSKERMVMSKNAIDRALDIKPNDAIVRMALGTYYYHGFRDYGNALAQYTQARDLAPGNAFANFYAAMIYRRLGDFNKTIELCERALDMDPRSELMINNTIQTYNSNRNYNRALVLIDKALTIHPNSAELFWPIHFTQNFIGQLEKAIETAEKTGDLSALLLINLYLSSGKYENIKRLLNKEPKDIFLDNWYYYPREYIEGIVLINQNKREAGVNKLKAAIDHLNGMIEANPDDPRFYMTLGLTYARIGDAKNAIKLGNRATEILPISRDALDGPTYEKQLAVIYGLVGENEKALKKIEYLSTIPAGFHYGELLYEPSFDSIRDEPRFQTVINKLKPQS